MKNALILALVSICLSGTTFGATKGPEIRIVDDKVTIQAEAVPLSRLLRLLDQVTGMTSKVPPELANRNVSVRFSGLKLEDAVHKIFEGLPLDYVLIQGHGIVVTGSSQPATATAGGPAPFTPPAPQEAFADDNPPFMPPQAGQQNPAMQNQPAMINTPFGPRPNPNAAQNVMQVQQQQGVLPNPNAFPSQPVNSGLAPMVAPGQPVNNPFNSSAPGFNSAPAANQNALPTASPFGANPVFPTQPGQTPPGYPNQVPPTRPIP
jgi:hypothetical protein